MTICNDCGLKHGNKKPGDGTTWHYGTCEICQKVNIPVTEARDFEYIAQD